VQFALHHQQGILLAGLLLRLAEALFVAFAILEFERVGGDQLGGDLFAGFRVEKGVEAAACHHAAVVAAFGADFEAALHLGTVENRATAGTFGPQPFRNAAFVAHFRPNSAGH